MTEKQNEPLLTVREVSKRFNIKESRLRWEIHLSRIPVYKIGSSILLRASEVEVWITSQKRAAHGKY